MKYKFVQTKWQPKKRKLLQDDERDMIYDDDATYSNLETTTTLPPQPNHYGFGKSDSSILTTTSVPMQSLKKRVFYVMGDIPYDSKEAILLAEQIDDLDPENDDVEFIVHLGDIMKARKCSTSEYSKVQSILLKAPVPVFIVPGDNDWNDCPAPGDAWNNWKTHFMRFDQRWNNRIWGVGRQRKRTENFVFLHRGVLFIGVHLVGGDVHEEEWGVRHAQSLRWTRNCLKRYSEHFDAVVLLGHAKRGWKNDDYFDPLFDLIDEAYDDIPFLYCHGDGHKYKVKEKYSNFLDVQVNSGKKAPPLKVTILYDSERRAKKKFSIDQRGGRY
eukprot:CAMPEP_0172481308 /NCGR_PEP_ID=MMETSP1066-20121228/7050_1 /TAXON_ID=671091 /ORGANISM="Coscinodiscus wailesii, Strain CCMP2513" /LENGTH=327 /DNA_ID=CAMNT_0013243449 /DNA_START=244 /DNA_END=1227 /DNA_ORIENTATION=-